MARLVAAKYGRRSRAARVATPTMRTANAYSREEAGRARGWGSTSGSSTAVLSDGVGSAWLATFPL